MTLAQTKIVEFTHMGHLPYTLHLKLRQSASRVVLNFSRLPGITWRGLARHETLRDTRKN